MISTNLHFIIQPCGKHEPWTQAWNCNHRDDYKDYEIEREETGTILEKLKNGKDSR